MPIYHEPQLTRFQVIERAIQTMNAHGVTLERSGIAGTLLFRLSRPLTAFCARVVREQLEATYPDHRIQFVHSDGSEVA